MHQYLRQPFRHTRLLTVAAALAAATIIAACGSSTPTGTSSLRTASSRPSASSSSSSSGSHVTSSTLPFSKCMRANGVPNFPDLSNNGIRIEGNSGQTITVNGVSVNAPAYAAARQKCEKYMPHTSGTPTPAQSAQEHQQALQFARCMRSNGVPNFPDPKVISSSGGNQTVYLPGINPYAPAFQTAAKKCGGGPKGP
jgi:hypothetical protein